MSGQRHWRCVTCMITFITRLRGVAQNKIIYYKFTYSNQINDIIKLNPNKHPQETGFNNEGAGLTSWRLVPQFSIIFQNIFPREGHSVYLCVGL